MQLDGEMLVNYDGDLLLGGRMFVGGKREFRRARMNRFWLSNANSNSSRRIVPNLTAIHRDCCRKVEAARASLVDNESKTVDLQSLIIKVDRGIHGLQIQVHAAREEITRAERHRKVVADEAGQIQSEIAELKQKLADALANKQAAEHVTH